MATRWKWASLPAGVLALWLSYSLNRAPNIPNDGYQYLDAASNLASGQCLCTRVALFDEQVAFGHFPIPFTHFAPGYPILIAAAERVGVTGATAGYLFSALGFLAVLWLIQDIALALGALAWVAAAFSLLWIAHATALLYGSMVGTESLFTALLLAVVALIERDARLRGASRFLPAGIGVVAGLSYWIRYPGLFLVGAAGVYLIARAWRFPRARRASVAGLVAAALLTGSVQIRNIFYTGSWRGGFDYSGRRAPGAVLLGTVRAFSHLITGDRVPVRFDVPMAIFLLSTALGLFLFIRAWFVRAGSVRETWVWTLFVGLAYTGGVILASLTTIAGDFPRYFFPVYPLLLIFTAVICSTVVCSSGAGGLKSLAVVLFVLSAVIVQGRNLFVAPEQPDWIFTRAILREEVQPGISFIQWLRKQDGPDEAIVAVEGQAVHYVVERPVVAVLPAEASARRMDEPGVRSLMLHFHSRYLLLFPDAPADRVPEQVSSPLLLSLAAGKVPAWLKPAAHTHDAAVYECEDCVK
jgi:hypothetical protein